MVSMSQYGATGASMQELQHLQALMASGDYADRCPPCPPRFNPRDWRRAWVALKKELGAAVRSVSGLLGDAFAQAAVAGCGGGCGGACGVCASPPAGRSAIDAYMGNVPADYEIPAAAAWDPVVARRCLSPIASEMLPHTSGQTPTDIPIEPSSGCFVGLWRKVFFYDANNPQTRVVGMVGRSFVGDCPASCRNQFMTSDALESDDCMGCPIPTVEIGKQALNEHLHNEVRNIVGDATSLLVQVVVWGVCYPSRGCMRWCRPASNGRHAA